MSLADNVRRPTEAASLAETANRPAPRRASVPPRLVTSAHKAASSRPDEAEPVSLKAVDDSFNLLDRASRSIIFLLSRYRQLEDHVRQLDAWSKAQIQAGEAAAIRWQESAAEAERKAQELQHALDVALHRAEVAETNVRQDRDALAALQQRVVMTFGFGSEAHDALAALDIE